MIYIILLFLTILLFIMNIKKVIQVGISDVFFEVFGISSILILNAFDIAKGNEDLLINLILTVSSLLSIELLYSDKHMTILELFKRKRKKKISKSEKTTLITLILISSFSLGALIHNSGMVAGVNFIVIISFILYILVIKFFPYFFIPTK